MGAARWTWMVIGACAVAETPTACPADGCVPPAPAAAAEPEDPPQPIELPTGGDPIDDGAPPADTAAPPADPPRTASSCFAGAFANPPAAGPDYDQFSPTVGAHCHGTHHQAITGVERVVFLGDSVTVGTPPTPSGETYRARLAKALAAQLGLRAPQPWWNLPDLFSTAELIASGDFATCARFGARTDDLAGPGQMMENCFPADVRDKRTLVVMTIGGNDIAAITQDGLDGTSPDAIWPAVRDFVRLQEEAIAWLTDPQRFPAGVFVVFANLHEFTDGTGDTSSCDLFAISSALGLGGFGGSWDDPDALAEMVIWANEQYARIAVESGTDMLFMLESFCGHGWRHDDPLAPCYRGPGTPRWLDATCIHPNSAGHAALTRMFMSTILDCDYKLVGGCVAP